MTKRHVVRLTDDQRADLEGRFCGRLTLRERNRVQVLLRSNSGDTDDEIAEALGICVATVVSVRKRFAAEGLEAALGERPRSGGPATFDGKVEAAVVALACSPTPDGRAEWTAKLIAGRLVELHVVERISERTVGRVLKKAGSSRGRRRRGACRAG
jgi:transposase